MLLFVALSIAILEGVKWYLIMVGISISLMTNDAEHVLKCLLIICKLSLKKNVHLELFFKLSSLLLAFKSSLSVWDTRPLSDI